MSRTILTLFAILPVATRRLRSNRLLGLAGLMGFLVAIALAFTLPIYADSVYQRILSRKVGSDATDVWGTPPFAFTFRFNTWGDYDAADYFIDQRAPQLIALPRETKIRYFQTKTFRLYPSEVVTDDQPGAPLLWSPIVSIGRFAEHAVIVDGAMPGPMSEAPPDPDARRTSRIEVLVSRSMAKALDMYVGRDYVALNRQSRPLGVPIVVAGIWEPADPRDPFWTAYQPDVLEKMLFVTEKTFVQLAPQIRQELLDVLWYMEFDGRGVRIWDVQPFIDRVNRVMAEANAANLNLSLGLSPVDKLVAYQRQSRQLAGQLFAFSVPVFALVFGFIVLVSGLMSNSRRGEIAVIRSRGATALQVIGMTVVEACVLAGAGMALAVPVSLGIAQLVGQTRSFLSFALQEILPVSLTTASLPFGLAVAVVAIVVTVAPVFGAAGQTIITYKLERARALKPAWWQRMWLDVLLFIPAAYWTYLLLRQGTVDLPGLGFDSNDPFSNPSLFLVPALAIFALTLFLVRLSPLFIQLLAWVSSRLPGTAMVLATRQLARSPGYYTAPLFMLILTLAFATFTASVASTLDTYLQQQARYEVGTDARLVKTGERRETVGWAGAGQGMSLPALGAVSLDGEDGSGGASDIAFGAGEQYSFLPLSDYLSIDSVQAAARAGLYNCAFKLSAGGVATGQYLGIDRTDYASVAFWRRDFADQPLGGLMNLLAETPEGVLVPEQMLQERSLRIGDLLPATVYVSRDRVDIIFKIVGVFKLWPAWYPNRDSGALVVGNLEYLFQEVGGQYPYDVWLKARPGADPAGIVARARAIDSQVSGARDIRSYIEAEQTRPERQGLFGILTTGFGAAAIFTVLGFTLYTVFSLRRRFIELGVLRAVGLSTTQLAAFLACELILLLGAGIAGGTLLGAAASDLYIPFLQTEATRSLPFQVVIDWTQVYLVYILFALIFIIALVALIAYVRRLPIFQAVKLGETE